MRVSHLSFDHRAHAGFSSWLLTAAQFHTIKSRAKDIAEGASLVLFFIACFTVPALLR